LSNTAYIISRYISNIFVPPSFTFLVFVYISIADQQANASFVYIVIQGLVLGLILPILFFFSIKGKGLVSDIDATIKEERLFPYLFGVAVTSFGIILNYYLGYSVLTKIWIIYFCSMLLLLLINKFWKVSAHAMGVSIPMGLLVYFEGTASMYYIPMVLLICWSRIHLQKHTTLQVVVGSGLGILLGLLLYII
jgi:membrane-associated phospholipid phosphatase